jgi:hypothetical protein
MTSTLEQKNNTYHSIVDNLPFIKWIKQFGAMCYKKQEDLYTILQLDTFILEFL